MSSDSDCFQDRVAKLRSLREKLCSKSSDWKVGFEVRDFVVCELQNMHEQLSKPDSDTTPEWCKEKVERILGELLSIPEIKTTGD
jgi:uncharacterized membrane protein